MSASPSILVLDTASPRVSVAITGPGGGVAERTVEIGRSSRRLLAMIDESLAESGLSIGGLDGIVALRGPGSFTGLRVGLATVLGLNQATGVAATAVSNLEALALEAEHALAASKEAASVPGGRIVAAVNALRGEWVFQPFAAGTEGAPEPLADPRRQETSELAAFSPCLAVGFGISGALERGELPRGVEAREPGPLAAAVALRASLQVGPNASTWPEWNPRLLTRPLYFRPPAVTLPKAKV